MRLFVHDYSGHPFQIELSRWLAGKGHHVLHVYSADIQTPRGALAKGEHDPHGFSVEGLTRNRKLAKYQLVRRRFQERAYARRLARRMAAFEPDIVLSSNTPPEVQGILLAAAHRQGARFISWVQDIYAVAAEQVLRDKIPVLGALAAVYLGKVEFAGLRRSDAVVAITEDFVPLLAAQGVPVENITVIENWAPLSEIVPTAKDNDWARRNGLSERFVFLYAGTLGLKHNPSLLAGLAAHFRHDPEVIVVVASEGLGRDWLERAKCAEALDNLVLLDFQPYDQLSQMLSSADVLVAILEAHAGVFSVPSKVLSYFCTARPVLGAIPLENLAARTIDRIGAGLLAAPDDEIGFLSAADTLRRDEATRKACAAAGRAFAEEAFDIDRIGDRFLHIIQRLAY